MREGIQEALYKKQESDPENENIGKQMLLLNKATISTIHSFCLDVIKNNFYQTNISPNFRLGSTEETELLKMEVLENTFDELYEEKNSNFINLVNTYGGYRDDENLKEIVLKIYKFIQSTPFPKRWLEENVEEFNLKDKQDMDFINTKWGSVLADSFKEEIESAIEKLEVISNDLKKDDSLSKFYFCILDDIDQLKLIVEQTTWDDIYNKISTLKFKTWPTDKKVVSELKDKSKEKRDEIKESIKKYKDNVFIYDSNQANKDLYEMYDVLIAIKELVLLFCNNYSLAKQEHNIIDFNDMEHIALDILVEVDEKGNVYPTEVAKKYQEKFQEIAIDEYQDSNLVQEYILNSVSSGNNFFMVGDVKQSIYKFRQARPELFLEKYNTYVEDGKDSENGRKIKLYENFRSRKAILNLTNFVFENIMSKELGDIEYCEEEFLNPGLEYEKTDLKTDIEPELHIIDLNQEETDIPDDEETEEIVDNIEIEAKFVANRIKELLNSNIYIWDKKQGYRNVTYKDFVILLRKTTDVASIYEKELVKLGYPVFCDTSSNYFESQEIETIMNLLRIIDNPTLDIPLVSVLRSPIVGLTDNELVQIRLIDKKERFYNNLLMLKDNIDIDEELKNKVKNFLDLLNDLEQKQEYFKLDELIWYIYEKTGYLNFVSLMTDGIIKVANLKMLFEKAKSYEEGSFKGLYNFICFIDRVKKTGSDMGAPKLIGENENVIRIMSIHKSKGLEFPIVFLGGTSKWFNTQDLNEKILLHQDMGFGPKYINYERKIEYSTLAKEAIKVKARQELLSEEMRLLYVALTRAREKIIITGTRKNYQEERQKKLDLLSINAMNNKIKHTILTKAKSYLDWLEYVFLNNENTSKYISIFVHKIDEVNLKDEETKDNSLGKILEKIPDKKIDEILNWVYPNIENTKTESKASVSMIAHKQEIKYQVEEIMPEFLKDDSTKLSGSEIGTVIHLVLQNLDYKKEYDLEKIDELLEELQEKKIINTIQKEAIKKEKILNYTKSNIFKNLRNAKKVYREKPFYINIPAKEIYENNVEEKILVQGIIDLFYIDENDNIVLIDYKTDYVPENDESYLIEKYNKQLELYKRAIKEAIGKNVNQTYIYSLYLDKEIVI